MAGNRHDRRAAASQSRKGQDTMGGGYTFGGVPESVSSHPAFKEGARRAASGEGLPPAYYEDIGEAARCIRSYLGARYLADSPDAFALLAWLDDATGNRLSLNQAGWALRLVGQLPMPSEKEEPQ